MEVRVDPEVEIFIQSLEKQTIAKVLRTIDLLEKFSHRLGMPHSKKVSKELFELRIRGRQEIRILYNFHRGMIYLLHGFIKKPEKIPRKDLERALRKHKALT